VRLSRLKVEGFKSLSDLDWRPAPGLSLVLGPNEAGKSTLAEFVEAMLFGVPGGAAGEEFRPWQGTGFGGRLELDCGRTLVVIERDFGSGDFSYEEIDTGDGRCLQPLSGQLRRGSSGALQARYRELLSRHLGFFDEKLFRRSTYVPQGELVLGTRDMNEAAAALRTMASGGGSGYDRALEVLNERYYALTSERDGRRKPGLLDELREEKARLGSQLREAVDHARRVSELRTALAESEAELKRLQQQGREAEALAERLRERAELLRRRAALAGADRSDRERLAAAEEACRQHSDLQRRLKAYDDLSAATEQLPQLISSAREAHDRVSRLESHGEALSEGAPHAYPYVKMFCTAGAVGLLGLAGLAAGLIAGLQILTVAGTAAAFAGIVAAGVIVHFRKRGDAADVANRDAARRASRDLAGARETFKSVTATLMTQTGGRVDFLPAAMDSLLKRYWERRELQSRTDALETSIMEEQELEELRSRISDTVRELATIDERLERSDALLGVDRRDDNADAQARRSAERSAELRSLTENCSRRVQGLEVDLASLSSARTASSEAEERLEEVARDIAVHENRCRALRLARSELTASIQEFQESHLDRLADLAGGIFGKLTGGRYKRVTLDPGTLVPGVDCQERQGVNSGQLSCGTRSALYLALRLAIGKLISGGRQLPLILDDPLVDLDEERRAASLELLEGLGEETQVLLLSFDRRLAECGAPVLELKNSGRR